MRRLFRGGKGSNQYQQKPGQDTPLSRRADTALAAAGGALPDWPEERLALAVDSTDPVVLTRLADDIEPSVRVAVATNPAAPAAVVAEMESRPEGALYTASPTPEQMDYLVANHPTVAFKHPALTYDQALRLAEAPQPWMAMAKSDPRLPAHRVEAWAESPEAGDRIGALSNPVLPEAVAFALASDLDREVARAALARMNALPPVDYDPVGTMAWLAGSSRTEADLQPFTDPASEFEFHSSRCLSHLRARP